MNQSHELIIPNTDIPFKMFLFEGKNGNYTRASHWHRSIEVFAVLDGSLCITINDKKHPLTKGDFAIINSNEIHSIEAPHPNYTVVIQIPLKAFEKYYTEEYFIRFTHLPMKEDKEIIELIREMFKAYDEKKIGYELKVQSQFYMLLHIMVKSYRENTAEPTMVSQHKKLNRLATITTYIKDNYNTDLSLESLAEIFAYSPTYLSRMFQKDANMNFKSYLQSVRLEYAYRELMNTDHSISQIAMNNGFPSSKAFSKLFVKKYNALPSAYRKSKKS